MPRSSLALVGPGRLELPTLRLSGVRSNHLSYGPMAAVPGYRARDQTACLESPYGCPAAAKEERETKTAASRI